MDVDTVWENLAQAITEMHRPEGDYKLKLDTVRAAVELLFEFPAGEILDRVEQSTLPTRAIVSWLVFEGDRLPGVDKSAVRDLREQYEAGCPPGHGIIPAPAAGAARGMD